MDDFSAIRSNERVRTVATIATNFATGLAGFCAYRLVVDQRIDALALFSGGAAITFIILALAILGLLQPEVV